MTFQVDLVPHGRHGERDNRRIQSAAVVCEHRSTPCTLVPSALNLFNTGVAKCDAVDGFLRMQMEHMQAQRIMHTHGVIPRSIDMW